MIRLTPIGQRRLANFKANRRGYWSLWIFLVLFVIALFAEFVANDKPLAVRGGIAPASVGSLLTIEEPFTNH
jgi:ABC-type microcin C transport system permease subunit YejE